MGFYSKGAPAACYLKHAGECFQASICIVVFWSHRRFVGRLLQAHRVMHKAVHFWPAEAGIAPGNRETKGSKIDSSVLV